MFLDRSVSTANDQTLTCKIEGLSATAAVVWEYGSVDIDENTQNDFDPDSGTLAINNQEATLVIKTSKLQTLGETSLFTCKVTSDEGDEKSESMTLTKLTYGYFDNYTYK